MKHSEILTQPIIQNRGCKLYANSFLNFLKRNQKTIYLCLIATFVWGLLTHSYIFLHSSFSHDSLKEFNAEVFGNAWRIQLGRVFVPAYRFFVRGAITLPWLIGVLSLLYISLAVFLTVKLFNIRSCVLMVLISGIFTANIAVIATAATYIHDLDCNMLALALAVISVYLWKKHDKGFLYGMIPLCLSIGLYQSYISVAITLIIMYLVMRLLDGEKFGIVFKNGMKSICMIVGAGVLFFVSMKMICYITGISLKTGNYNSIDTVFSMSIPGIIYTAIKGYIITCYKILTVTSAYPKTIIFVVHAIMIAIPGVIVLCRIFQKDIKIKEKILTLVLIALIPISMNIVYPLTGGMSHDLMEYGLWLVYLFVLLIAWWAVERFSILKPSLKFLQRLASVCLVLVVLWGNVQTANAAYLKKDLERDANFSLFTRVVYQMENCDGYITGETPVVFVGKPDALLDKIPGFEHVYNITGCWNSFVLNSNARGRYQAYFDYILLNPAIMADEETWSQMQNNDEAVNMPCYPAMGSVAIVDGVLVVKMGE